MVFKLVIVSIALALVNALTKMCAPSFHDTFLSGGDEINMRWEYCTKMTFKRNGQA